ncbi:hypothetical protein BDV10DRAFT_57314 [Aspergillus recurvatus]
MNEALEFDVDALVTTQSTFCCRKKISVTALTKYSAALRRQGRVLLTRFELGKRRYSVLCVFFRLFGGILFWRQEISSALHAVAAAAPVGRSMGTLDSDVMYTTYEKLGVAENAVGYRSQGRHLGPWRLLAARMVVSFDLVLMSLESLYVKYLSSRIGIISLSSMKGGMRS